MRRIRLCMLALLASAVSGCCWLDDEERDRPCPCATHHSPSVKNEVRSSDGWHR